MQFKLGELHLSPIGARKEEGMCSAKISERLKLLDIVKKKGSRACSKKEVLEKKPHLFLTEGYNGLQYRSEVRAYAPGAMCHFLLYKAANSFIVKEGDGAERQVIKLKKTTNCSGYARQKNYRIVKKLCKLLDLPIGRFNRRII